MNQEIMHVYFMPGMAASPRIFENIKLPESKFEMHFLEWLIPEKNEPLQNYALRLTKYIKHDNPVLIGVSFALLDLIEQETSMVRMATFLQHIFLDVFLAQKVEMEY